VHKIDYSIKQKGAELSTGKLVKASTCMGPAVQVTKRKDGVIFG